MPKTYYAITQPIIAATTKSVPSKHFQGMEEVKNNKRFTYNDLVSVISADTNLKLYPSERIAQMNAPERESVEDEKSESFGWAHLAAAYFFPILSAAAYVADALIGPNQVKNSYKSIIIKVTILDDSCIADPPEEQAEGDPCLGVLPKLQLRKHANDEKRSRHDWNIRFSKNSNYYIHSIVFNGQEYSHFWTHYPTKYVAIVKASQNSAIFQVANLLNDYHSPKLGLFLTGHWNRTHQQEAKMLEEHIKRAAGPTEALDILWRKREELERSGTCNLNGSFFKRITYAIEMLAPVMQEARYRPPHRR
jgi:hypothetical protein